MPTRKEDWGNNLFLEETTTAIYTQNVSIRGGGSQGPLAWKTGALQELKGSKVNCDLWLACQKPFGFCFDNRPWILENAVLLQRTAAGSLLVPLSISSSTPSEFCFICFSSFFEPRYFVTKVRAYLLMCHVVFENIAKPQGTNNKPIIYMVSYDPRWWPKSYCSS